MARVIIPGFRKIETSGGGEGGTTNYNDLSNKPSINNVSLVGNLNTVDLKLTDSTLTEEGVPAESKTVGKKLEEQSTSLTALSNQLGNHTVKSDVPENAVFTDTVYDDTEVKEEIDEINSNLDALQFGEVAGGKNLFKVNTNYWSLTDNGIKNNDRNEGAILGNIKLIAGKTYKIYLLLKSKPTLDSSFVATINGNEINSISFIKINEFNLNEKIEYNYTPTSDCELLYKLWGNSNSDIFEFQFQVEEGSVATDYEPYIPSVKMLAEDVASLKNDLDKLNALPIGTIIQIEADKDTIATTEAKYSWQYLGTSNIQYENGGAYILEANVYRKNN